MSRLFAIGLDATKSHRVPVTGRKMFVDIPLHRTRYLKRDRVISRFPDFNSSSSRHTLSEFPFGLFSFQQHELLDRISTDLWNLHVPRVGADN